MQQHEVIWMSISFWDLSFHSEEKGSIFVQNWQMYVCVCMCGEAVLNARSV